MMKTRTVRTMVVFTIALLLPFGTSASPQMQRVPEGHQSAEESAVLKAMDRYMTAIAKGDPEELGRLQRPDGMTFQWRPDEGGGMQITARPNSYWSDPASQSEDQYREQYWAPTVLIRGAIAVVWAPYEFWINGETSHCGVDVFDFVKIDGKWLVSNAMWTVEPDACSELSPTDATTLRPAD